MLLCMTYWIGHSKEGGPDLPDLHINSSPSYCIHLKSIIIFECPCSVDHWVTVSIVWHIIFCIHIEQQNRLVIEYCSLLMRKLSINYKLLTSRILSKETTPVWRTIGDKWRKKPGNRKLVIWGTWWKNLPRLTQQI